MNKWSLVLFFYLSFCLSSFANLTFEADSMKTDLAKGKERTLLNGKAHIRSDEIDILAEHVEMYGEDKNIIVCKGNINVKNFKTGVQIVCENLYYDRSKKMIRIHGNAVMEDKENEIVIKGGYIENWEDKDETIIQIGVSILKENMVCRAESARYFRKEDRLELSGMPVVVKDGDEFKALKINIDLENDNVEMEGNVSGEVAWKEEKTSAADESAAKTNSSADEATVSGTNSSAVEISAADKNMPQKDTE